MSVVERPVVCRAFVFGPCRILRVNKVRFFLAHQRDSRTWSRWPSLRRTRVAGERRWWSCGCKMSQEKMKKPKKELKTPLERATEAYYANMTPEELKAERELEDAIAGAPKGIDVDRDL